jgi:HEAT repeat protein
VIECWQEARIDETDADRCRMGVCPPVADETIHAIAYAQAAGIARVTSAMMLSAGLVIGGAGCMGGSTESAVTESTAPEAAAIPVAEVIPAATDAVTRGVPDSKADPVSKDSHTSVAREAFRVLITPGSDSAAWETAQKQLVALGPEATPVLLDGLKSDHSIERETAATVCALSGVEDVHLKAALTKCLSDEVSFVRANAAAALAQSPEHQLQVMSTLTDLLADTDPQLRRLAAANLGSFGEEASRELSKLTAVLTDSDAEVVTPVIQLLGRIGPRAVDAVPQLQKIAFEQDGDLKQAAERALLLIQTDATDNAKPNP